MKNKKFKDIPKTFIAFTDFGHSMFKRTIEEITAPSDWDYHDLRRGHDAIITAPNELSKLLLPLLNK
jgi:hypothetical protein